MPGGQPGTVRGIIQREAALRGQHDRLGDVSRPAGEPAADDLLRHPGAVHIGRVDQGAARLGKTVDLRMRARLVRLRSEGHGPKAKARHRAAATPQSAIVHASTYAAPASRLARDIARQPVGVPGGAWPSAWRQYPAPRTVWMRGSPSLRRR